jgi:putative two-component system response regulator
MKKEKELPDIPTSPEDDLKPHDLDRIDEVEELEELPENPEEESDEIISADPVLSKQEVLDNIAAASAKWIEKEDSICIPAIVLNKDLNVFWHNTSFRKAMGSIVKSGSHPLSSFFSIIQEDKSFDDFRSLMDHASNDYCWQCRVTKSYSSPENFMANLLMFPITFDDDRKPVHFLGLVDDITDEYKQILRSTFNSLLEASKLKDNDTGHHIQRVNRYSYLMAKRLLYKNHYDEVDPHFVENVGYLASMHDVGKIGTPDDILNKEGPLEPWEREVMKEHTKNGAFLLSTYPNPMARVIALSHHERYDGSGYPYGLEEDMIPLPARIVAIADVYDALRSRRSYKEPFSHKDTIDYMETQKNTHFDPHLLDIFITHNKVFEQAYLELSDD